MSTLIYDLCNTSHVFERSHSISQCVACTESYPLSSNTSDLWYILLNNCLQEHDIFTGDNLVQFLEMEMFRESSRRSPAMEAQGTALRRNIPTSACRCQWLVFVMFLVTHHFVITLLFNGLCQVKLTLNIPTYSSEVPTFKCQFQFHSDIATTPPSLISFLSTKTVCIIVQKNFRLSCRRIRRQ